MHTKHTHRAGAALLCFTSVALAGTPPVIYVNASAPAGGDGTSWATAYRDLNLALDRAVSSQEIWIAEGTYVPTRHWGFSTPPVRSYAVPGGVRLFGGFQGTETSRDQRDPLAHPTLLSGDINADDGPNFTNRDDNTPIVVRLLESVTNAPTELDGLVIFGSWIQTQTTSSQPGPPLVIANCRFDGNNASPSISSRELTMTDTIFTNIRDSSYKTRALVIANGGVARVERCTFDNIGPSFQGVSAIVDCEFRDCGAVIGGQSVAVDNRWHDSPERAIGVGASVWGALVDTSVISDSAQIYFHVHAGLISGGNFPGTRLVELNETSDLDPPVFHDCHFSGEYDYRMFTTYDGAGATFQHCSFTDIRGTTFSPMAMYLNKGPFLFEDCLFARNEGELLNFHPDGANAPTFTFRRCRFIANMNSSVRIAGTPVVLEDSIFVGNRHDAGALITSDGGGLAMNNCTFAFNNLQWYVPVVNAGWDETVVLQAHNCVFRHNGPSGTQVEMSPLPQIDSPFVTVTNCVGNTLDTLYPGAGNINADPLFVDPLGPDQVPATGDEDVQLAAGSPCIDAGHEDIDTNPFVTGVQPIGAFDADAKKRVWAGNPAGEPRIDMGALEHGAPAVGTPAHEPRLLIPADQHPRVGTRPVLAWLPVAGAQSYRVEIAQDAAFEQVIADIGGVLRLCLDTKPLQLPARKELWWRVTGVGHQASLTSEARSFTTAIHAPPQANEPIASDLNNDCRVDSRDLSVLVLMLNMNPGPVDWYSYKYDINRDAFLNAADLSVLLSQFGAVCSE